MIDTVGPYLVARVYRRHASRRLGAHYQPSSAAALHTPGPLNSAYATSKVVFNQLTRHLAAELEGQGVTANVIHPGDVKLRCGRHSRQDAGVRTLGRTTTTGWLGWKKRAETPEKAAQQGPDIIETA